MRIGLNLAYLLPKISGGTETYADSLIRALSAIDHENEYYLFLNQECAHRSFSESPNFVHVVCGFSATHKTVRYGWEQIVLPFLLVRYAIDIVHSLAYTGPVITRMPSIITLHDLNFLALGTTMTRARRSALRLFSTASARRASYVITDSDFSRRAIIENLKISPAAVSSIPLGPGPLPNPSISWSSVQQRYDMPSSYILALSSRSPHKNISRLIEAYRKALEQIHHTLVLVGFPPFGEGKLNGISAFSNDGSIKFLGYVPTEHLSLILQHATLFVMPSLYEGFGLPILEAQAVDVAVACSTAASLPEVAGKGALYFNPESVDGISDAIVQCLLDSTLRDDLKCRGRQNLRRFSWDTTARATLEIYAKAYSARTGQT